MKQFDLQEYLKNPQKKIVTSDGESARIICTDRNPNYPIVALVGEATTVKCYTKKGQYFGGEISSSMDLFFAPEKKTGWINLYDLRGKIVCGVVYASEKAARGEIDPNKSYITTIPIEWEE